MKYPKEALERYARLTGADNTTGLENCSNFQEWYRKYKAWFPPPNSEKPFKPETEPPKLYELKIRGLDNYVLCREHLLEIIRKIIPNRVNFSVNYPKEADTECQYCELVNQSKSWDTTTILKNQQELLDIMMEIAMAIAGSNKRFRKQTPNQIGKYIRVKLRECGIHAIPLGASHAVLKTPVEKQ